MELLEPVLLQTIRNVALSEQLARHRFLVDELQASAEPLALAGSDLRVVFATEAFRALFPATDGGQLPPELAAAVKRAFAGPVRPRLP